MEEILFTRIIETFHFSNFHLSVKFVDKYNIFIFKIKKTNYFWIKKAYQNHLLHYKIHILEYLCINILFLLSFGIILNIFLLITIKY